MKVGNRGEQLSPETKKEAEKALSKLGGGMPIEITEEGDNLKGLMNDSLEFGEKAINSFSEDGTAGDAFDAGLNFGSQITKRVGDSIESSLNSVIVESSQ